MSELVLKCPDTWGTQLVVSMPCGHDSVVLPAWINADGRFLGRLSCSVLDCRKVYDEVRLEGWRP